MQRRDELTASRNRERALREALVMFRAAAEHINDPDVNYKDLIFADDLRFVAKLLAALESAASDGD